MFRQGMVRYSRHTLGVLYLKQLGLSMVDHGLPYGQPLAYRDLLLRKSQQLLSQRPHFQHPPCRGGHRGGDEVKRPISKPGQSHDLRSSQIITIHYRSAIKQRPFFAMESAIFFIMIVA